MTAATRTVLLLTVVVSAALSLGAERVGTDIPSTTYKCQPPFCDKVLRSLSNAVTSHAAPGIAAAVVRTRDSSSQDLLYVGSVGRYTYDKTSAEVTNETLFDMASCTKVTMTTTAIAELYQAGLLGLDDFVTQYLGSPFGVHGKDVITIRQLLLHIAGFPPDPTPYWYYEALFGCPETAHYYPRQAFSCDSRIFNALLNQTLVNPPGTKYVYSDLSMITGMFVVGSVVRKHRNTIFARLPMRPPCLDETNLVCLYHAYVGHNVIDAFAMKGAGFIPNDAMQCVPQWFDDYYRHRMISGFVSDENAFALGGISGHAGLFASVESVIALMRRWMLPAENDPLLNRTTVQLFTTVANISMSSRALGWDTNDQSYLPCGTLSKKTFTHMGFTGTQVCGDPENQVFTVLLGNGRYPEKSHDGMYPYRPIFGTLVKDLLGP